MSLLTLVLGACGIDTGGLGGERDSGNGGLDATVDANALDASVSDAAALDAAIVDAPPADAGMPEVDASPAGPDGGPPNCRLTPETCAEPGIGAGCAVDGDCWPGLVCCTDDRCGAKDEIGGTCTILGCGVDGATDACPLDMICWHGICFFPCDMGTCPHADQKCDHATVCEWD